MKKHVLKAVTRWIAVACSGFSQAPLVSPAFQGADVHVSRKIPNPMMRIAPLRGDRYEVKFASTLDLIHLAYSIEAEKVLGGPNWLEMDRFDVLAKAPPGSTQETLRLMLQTLLKERFALMVHKATGKIPAYALIAEKHPHLKEANPSDNSGCRPETIPALSGGTSPEKEATSGTSRHSSTIHYACRKVTMAAFAASLRTMMGSLGSEPVFDQTGLSGEWSFDLTYSLPTMDPLVDHNPDKIGIFEALHVQLGLKLEKRQVPTPVIVVDSVNERPSDNPQTTDQVLSSVQPATEFEVADVKVAGPNAGPAGYQIQPGGRVIIRSTTMRPLISRAFDLTDRQQIVGLQAWADIEKYDIFAKAPAVGDLPPTIDADALGPLLRSLLIDRFKMAYHQEERAIDAYALVSVSPRLKRSTSSDRTSCTILPAPVSAPPPSLQMACRNITVAQFADQLQYKVAALTLPVLDLTGIGDRWDFSFIYSPIAATARNLDLGSEETAAPAESSGALTIFEAVRKQLGLRLERHKRMFPVIVVDRLERMPTGN